MKISPHLAATIITGLYWFECPHQFERELGELLGMSVFQRDSVAVEQHISSLVRDQLCEFAQFACGLRHRSPAAVKKMLDAYPPLEVDEQSLRAAWTAARRTSEDALSGHAPSATAGRLKP